MSGEDSEKTLQKRRPSSPSIPSRGRSKKAAKWVAADIDSDEEILSELPRKLLTFPFFFYVVCCCSTIDLCNVYVNL